LQLNSHIGAVGSSDTWTQEANSLREMNSSQNTLCEEMEGASLAQVCDSFEIPFACVKDISNNELHVTTEKQKGALSSLDLSNIGALSAQVAVSATKIFFSKHLDV
jgi:nucleoside phosphorylase